MKETDRQLALAEKLRSILKQYPAEDYEAKGDDIERCHVLFDRAIVAELRYLGYESAVTVYESTDKWWA